jgi:PPOX class probable F420-dependent enzyme
MLTDTIRAFLAVPRIARLATIDADSYPHVVPIWFGVDGDDIVFMSDRETAKVRNALANPHGAVTIGGGKGDSDGYMFRGQLSVYTDEGHAVTNALARRYETPQRAEALIVEWENDDVVVIRLKPVKITKVV